MDGCGRIIVIKMFTSIIHKLPMFLQYLTVTQNVHLWIK